MSERARQVSSAKSLGVLLTDEGKSLIYSKNSNGPRIDPCGTPELLVNKVEVFSLIYTYCFLCKNERIKLLAPDPVMSEFRKKSVMVNSIESFG